VWKAFPGIAGTMEQEITNKANVTSHATLFYPVMSMYSWKISTIIRCLRQSESSLYPVKNIFITIELQKSHAYLVNKPEEENLWKAIKPITKKLSD
jgi:hypothetical protein